MDDDRELTDGERMIRRAQGVALGLADAGLSQAEEMLRRVSPEGRARAKRAAAERARRRNAVIGQIVLVALAAVLVAGVIGVLTPFAAPAALAALLVTIVAAVLFVRRASRRSSTPVQLAATDLPQLPAQTGRWLEAQRPALPAPAVQLTDVLSRRLDELQPQLARLPADEPAGDAVRKLLATELPQLVEGYRAIPPSMRRQPRPDGRTADAHLLDGLKLIDTEVARMTEQLARGAFDQVATQHRYLELKYHGDM